MDPSVAVCAGRQLRRSSTHTVERARGDRAMALIAQGVDRWHVQQSSILRTMRSMAAGASLRLDRSVLKDERSTRLNVALGTNLVLIESGLQVVSQEGAMCVVAVAASDRAFGHGVVEGHCEHSLHIAVALVTELRLGRREEHILG